MTVVSTERQQGNIMSPQKAYGQCIYSLCQSLYWVQKSQNIFQPCWGFEPQPLNWGVIEIRPCIYQLLGLPHFPPKFVVCLPNIFKKVYNIGRHSSMLLD